MDVVLLQAEMNKVKEEAITKIERDSGTHNGVITCRHQTLILEKKEMCLSLLLLMATYGFSGVTAKMQLKTGEIHNGVF